jgi:hypothetical protein
MFKFKKRSAHGINPVHKYSSYSPGTVSTSAKMEIAGDVPAQASDSVITADADAGAVNEPLVLDFAAMHDDHTKEQSPPLTPPPSHKTSHERDQWLSDEDRDTPSITAPPPPDFTRRGIHIPSRTR